MTDLRTTVLCVTTLGALACAPPESVTEGHLRILEQEVAPLAAASMGLVTEHDETAVAFTFLADAAGAEGYFASLREQGGGLVFRGEDWWESEFNYTNAPFVDSTLVLNWPVDADDPEVLPDTRYTAMASFGQGAGRWTFRAAAKRDANLDQGTVRVRVVVDQQVAETRNWADAIDQAVAIWRDEIFDPDLLGLDLVTETVVRDIGAQLFSPGFGDGDVYRALASERDPGWIDLVMVRSIRDGDGLYGIAGGIPGPVGVTDRSAVLVNMQESTGVEEPFTAQEIEVLAETMAHEVGHYLGLFHPVEIPDDDAVTSWDALDDTANCVSFDDCVQVLPNNLMFPTPVCFESGDPDNPDCIRQTALTPDQEGLVQRYVLVD